MATVSVLPGVLPAVNDPLEIHEAPTPRAVPTAKGCAPLMPAAVNV